MSDKMDKVKSGLLNSAGFIAVFATAGVFLIRSFIDISATGKSIAEILIDGALSLVFGWVIKMMLAYQGMLNGLNSKAVKDTTRLHGEAIIKIEQYFPLLGDFCDKMNAELRIRKRTIILSKELLRYEDVFNDDHSILEGIIKSRLDAIDVSKSALNTHHLRDRMRWFKCEREKDRKRRSIMRCVSKANNIRLTELSQHELTTDSTNIKDPFRFPDTMPKRMAKRGLSMLGISLALAIPLGYLVIKPGLQSSWEDVIGGLIQICIYIGFGLMQFFKEYFFMIDTYRKGTIRKIDLLNQFYEEAKQGVKFVVPAEIIKRGDINGNSKETQTI